MHAKIGYYATAYHPLWYNERKVSRGLAIRLEAGNFLEDTGSLNLHDIARRFSSLEKLNERSHQKAFHIPVSFSRADHLSIEQYKAIGKEYMSGMGLGRQPYVIYLHQDTNQPHLHFVASRITPKGERLVLDRKPATLSINAIESIVDKYQLARARKVEMPKEPLSQQPEPTKMIYGRSPTTQTIHNILSYVLPTYNYTNIDELNAALLFYNIYADIGSPGSLTFDKRGLVYQVHDSEGRFIGGRIPAHRLPSHPGRDFLETQFAKNEQNRPEKLRGIRVSLFMIRPDNLSSMSRMLRSDQISVYPFMNKAGLIHELAFVDHHYKVAVTASNLGEKYTVERLFEKMGQDRQFQLADKDRKLRIDQAEERRLTPAGFSLAMQQLALHEKIPDSFQLSRKLVIPR